MKVYISGKITGLPEDEYRQNFQKAQLMLHGLGYEAVNPLHLNHEGATWKECMKEDIKALLECDAIAMLPNWINSMGAKIEHNIALGLKMEVCYIRESRGKYVVYRFSEKNLCDAIEAVTGINEQRLTQKTRIREIVDARKIYCKIAHEYLTMPSTVIARKLKQDHATVLHAVKKVKDLIDTDAELRRKYETVMAIML